MAGDSVHRRRVGRAFAALAFTVAACAWGAPLPVFFNVPSDTMAPALPKGTLIAQSPIAGALARRDIVIVATPDDPATLRVQRIAALPGDRVQVVDGRWRVNDEFLSVPAEFAPVGRTRPAAEFPFPGSDTARTLAPDEYVVLNDNPASLADSRSFGPVGHDALLARAQTWAEILASATGPRPFLQRILDQWTPRLPIDVDGMRVMAVRLIGDRDIEIRYELPGEATRAMSDAIRASLRTALQEHYCGGTFARLMQVRVRTLLDDAAAVRLATIDFDPKDCAAPAR